MTSSILWRGILPRVCFLFAFLAIFISSQSLAEIIIDDFELGSVSFSDPTPGWQTNFYTQTSLSTDHVVGGVRALQQFGEGLPSIMSVAVGPGDDSMDLTIPANKYGSYTITWNGNSAGYGSLNILNLDLSGESQFEMAFFHIEQPMQCRIMVLSDGGNAGDSANFTVTEPGTVIVPFSDYEDVDWSDVDHIQANYGTYTRNPTDNVQSISDFRATPEPSTILMLSIVLLGFVCRRSR